MHWPMGAHSGSPIQYKQCPPCWHVGQPTCIPTLPLFLPEYSACNAARPAETSALRAQRTARASAPGAGTAGPLTAVSTAHLVGGCTRNRKIGACCGVHRPACGGLGHGVRRRNKLLQLPRASCFPQLAQLPPSLQLPASAHRARRLAAQVMIVHDAAGLCVTCSPCRVVHDAQPSALCIGKRDWICSCLQKWPRIYLHTSPGAANWFVNPARPGPHPLPCSLPDLRPCGARLPHLRPWHVP